MAIYRRVVTFECGHVRLRVCRNGRSLVGEQIRCDGCSFGTRGVQDRRVVREDLPLPLDQSTRDPSHLELIENLARVEM